MRNSLSLAAASTMLALAAVTAPAHSAAEVYQIETNYEAPKNPAHQVIHDTLKNDRVLEHLQSLLSAFRLPKPLEFALAGCDGEADAFYGEGKITVCYEYVADLWKHMPKTVTDRGVAPEDTVLGPMIDTSLHEFAHALFDLFNPPMFGREEDGADQVAAYMYLHLGEADARRLITGTAYTYLREARAEASPQKISSFSGEHSTPAQRVFNVMCMAYGANPDLFSDFTDKGYLPEERAEYCWEEFDQIDYAFKQVFLPHLDLKLAKKFMHRNFLCKKKGKDTKSKHSRCVLTPPK